MSYLLKNPILILLVILVAVPLVIILIRFIFSLILEYCYKKYIQIKNNEDENKDKKHKKKNINQLPKEDEALFIDKENSNKIEIIPAKQSNNDKSVDEIKIVGVAKSIGFWTSFILGSKLTNIISTAQEYNKESDQGFWVSMVKAKGRAAGRQRGRSL